MTPYKYIIIISAFLQHVVHSFVVPWTLSVLQDFLPGIKKINKMSIWKTLLKYKKGKETRNSYQEKEISKRKAHKHMETPVKCFSEATVCLSYGYLFSFLVRVSSFFSYFSVICTFPFHMVNSYNTKIGIKWGTLTKKLKSSLHERLKQKSTWNLMKTCRMLNYH